MPATQFNTNNISAQPALSLSRNENGAWSANHVIMFDISKFASAFPLLQKGQLLSGVDPDIPSPFDSFLLIETISINRTEGDLYEVNIKAVGSGEAQFDFDEENIEAIQPTYTLSGTIQEAPLTEHRKFLQMPEDEQLLWHYEKMVGQLDDPYDQFGTIRTWLTQKGYFTIKNPTDVWSGMPSQTVADFIFEEYNNPTFKKCIYTWTEDTEGTLPFTPQQLNSLGKKTSVRGNPPQPSNDRDWLLTSINQQKTGEIYRTSVTWTLSDVGGWDEYLYQ